MVKIIAVEYLNTLPFIHGLRNSSLWNQIQLITGTPQECAQALMNETVDIALLPIGAISQFKNLSLISDYCIGCDGPVRTVAIYSNKEFREIKSIKEDASSRTSNLLLSTLNRIFWKEQTIEIIPASESSIEADSYLIIGDQSFVAETQFKHQYDLGEIWKNLTGRPFTFAVWASRNKISSELEDRINQIFKLSIEHIESFIKTLDLTQFPPKLDAYFSENISYHFDQAKKDSLHYFCELNQVDLSSIIEMSEL